MTNKGAGVLVDLDDPNGMITWVAGGHGHGSVHKEEEVGRFEQHQEIQDNNGGTCAGAEAIEEGGSYWDSKFGAHTLFNRHLGSGSSWPGFLREKKKLFKIGLISLVLVFAVIFVILMFRGHGNENSSRGHGNEVEILDKVDGAEEIKNLLSSLLMVSNETQTKMNQLAQQVQSIKETLDERKVTVSPQINSMTPTRPTTIGTIRVFQGRNFTGDSIVITLPLPGECKPIPKAWNDRIGSIDSTSVNCVMVCAHCFCTEEGPCRQLIAGTHGDLTSFGLHNEITSLTTC